ncbi:MAG: stage II sporulation protein M [Cyanobacteria bacterium J069]|nr:MAG: stage II sporulation protein M [Cyanobacteria bacterium J069]
MDFRRWTARREPSWSELDRLLQQAERRGLKSLTATEIHQLASLYRAVSGDLARAQHISPHLTQELQALTTRGYAQVYQGLRRQEWQAVRQFYLSGFPAVVQQCAGYIAVATGLFVLAGLMAWWYAWRDPSFIDLMVPDSIIRQVRDRQELWMGSIVGVEPYAASNIMVNNLKVSFAAAAGGITAGLATVYILLLNGVNIGAIATLVGQNNLAFPFWAFVFPHGALELPAIFLAGAAGLLIARALLFPGRLRRVDALKCHSTQAAQLMYGVVPLLVIAGIIEGFFSPNPAVPDLLKYVAGTGLFAALVWYCRREGGME